MNYAEKVENAKEEILSNESLMDRLLEVQKNILFTSFDDDMIDDLFEAIEEEFDNEGDEAFQDAIQELAEDTLSDAC